LGLSIKVLEGENRQGKPFSVADSLAAIAENLVSPNEADANLEPWWMVCSELRERFIILRKRSKGTAGG
jgi:hypothetical protein